MILTATGACRISQHQHDDNAIQVMLEFKKSGNINGLSIVINSFLSLDLDDGEADRRASLMRDAGINI